jgi:hypothetical protein
MILVGVDRTLGGHHVKGSNADVAKRLDRPAVVAIGLSESVGEVQADLVLLEQRPDIKTPRDGELQGADGFA